MDEKELTLKLWNDVDELGFDYEQIKSLALSMILNTMRDKSYEEIYHFLSNIKSNYITGNEIIN